MKSMEFYRPGQESVDWENVRSNWTALPAHERNLDEKLAAAGEMVHLYNNLDWQMLNEGQTAIAELEQRDWIKELEQLLSEKSQ